MWPTLAQATTSTDHDTVTIIPRLFNRLDALAHPQELVKVLEQMGWVIASIFVVTGLVCLLQGYKLYKWVVILLALTLGGAVGYKLGQQIQAEVIVAGCAAVLLAVVAWPFMKYAVALAGGLAGAFIGANAWTGLAQQISQTTSVDLSPDAYWAGALMGIILFGMMSFILFELSVVLFTSVSGSVLAVLGILALLLQVPAWREAIGKSLEAHPLVIPLLVIVPAVIGLVIQQSFGGLQKGNADTAK
jgi:hypothetical protein